MTRTQRFLGGLTAGYAYQALVTLVNMWLTAFLLRLLGNHEYGLWLVALQILGYLLLADLGIVALLPRETAYATGRAGSSHETPEVPALVGTAVKLVLWQMPIVALLAFSVWLKLPEQWAPLRGPFVLISMVFVLTFPLRILQAILTGLQDLTFVGLVQLGGWVAGTSLTVLLALTGFGLYALIWGWVVSQLVTMAACWQRFHTRYPLILPRQLPAVGWSEAKTYLSKSVWVSLAQVAQVLVNGSDMLIIGSALGPAAAVPYFCTDKLVTVLGNQPQLAMQAAGPALAELRTAESRSRILQATTALTVGMLIASGAVACVVVALNQGFVRWWVGAGRFGGVSLSLSLTALMVLRHWNVTAAYAIFAFGHERRISLTTLLDGFVTVGGALLLIPNIGAIGAPLASIAGVLLVSLPANLTALARETGQTPFGLARSLGPWLWRFLLVALVALAMSPYGATGSLFRLIIAAVGIGLLYAAVMIPLALRDPLVQYVRPRLRTVRTRFLRRLAGNADA